MVTGFGDTPKRTPTMATFRLLGDKAPFVGAWTSHRASSGLRSMQWSSHLQPMFTHTSQNWIGGSRPGNAAFVPPPHTAVPDCMAELERFFHAEGDGLPILARAGLVARAV